MDPRHKQRALLIALLVVVALWNLPFGDLLLYPFKLWATWLHEMSHGIVMVLSGAGFDHLEIYRDTSGIAYGKDAVGPAARAAIASAGYLGAAVLGATFLMLGQSRRAARSILAAIAIALAISAAVWVRNGFGIGAVLVGAAGCIALTLFAGERVAVYAVNFLAAQSCVNALLDIRVLFRDELVINGRVVGSSDAHNMAEATFGSYKMWAGIWLAWSLVSFYIALRRVALRDRGSGSAAGI